MALPSQKASETDGCIRFQKSYLQCFTRRKSKIQTYLVTRKRTHMVYTPEIKNSYHPEFRPAIRERQCVSNGSMHARASTSASVRISRIAAARVSYVSLFFFFQTDGFPQLDNQAQLLIDRASAADPSAPQDLPKPHWSAWNQDQLRESLSQLFFFFE